MQDLVFNDIDQYEHKRENLIKGSKDRLCVVADFDRTLTTNFSKGRKAPSMISALRDGKYLSPDYAAKAKALFEYYRPMEMDNSIALADKQALMLEWYERHFDLLIASGISQEKMALAIDGQLANLRPLVKEFLEILRQENVPLIIFSATGIGVSGLKYYFSQRGLLSDNISFIANDFIWGDSGEARAVKKPIIHPFNKDELMFESFGLKEKLVNKANIILLGDSLADASMLANHPVRNILKFGFLNDRIIESLDDYKQVYDALILNDGDFKLINELVKDIVNFKKSN